MKPILRVFNPVPIDRLDCRTTAVTGQVVAVDATEMVERNVLIKSPDQSQDLGLVSVLSLVPLPHKYKYDPNTGLNKEIIN